MSWRFMSRALALLSSLPTLALALPTAPDVQAGSALLDRVDQATMHITCQDKTVINWDTFSIDSHEALKFIQQVDSTVLNRVTGHITGGHMSRIMGSLESQGHVYILNPQGIFIGKEAVINVGSLIASTLNITNADFFTGKDGAVAFKGKSREKILNLGTIKALSGDVHVVAYSVENQGEIEAKKGHVTLNACQEAILQPASKKCVLFKVQLDLEASSEGLDSDNKSAPTTGIDNTGVIKALQAKLSVEGNLYKLAINQSGHIEAKTFVEGEGGKVFLTANEGAIKLGGLLSAQGYRAKEGHIEVVGSSIFLEDSLEVWGKALIGGVPYLFSKRCAPIQKVCPIPHPLCGTDVNDSFRIEQIEAVAEVVSSGFISSQKISNSFGYTLLNTIRKGYLNMKKSSKSPSQKLGRRFSTKKMGNKARGTRSKGKKSSSSDSLQTKTYKSPNKKKGT